MRWRTEDPLPNVSWDSTTQVSVSRRPGHDGWVRMLGGGMVRIPDAGLTCNTAASGAGGINAGSSVPVTEWMYLYLYDNGGTAAVTLDNTGPVSGGPSGISQYRYIAPVKFLNGDVFNFTLQNGWVSFFNGWTIHNLANQTNDVWFVARDMLADQLIPETAGMISISGCMDCDVDIGAKQNRMVIATYPNGTPPDRPTTNGDVLDFRYDWNAGGSVDTSWTIKRILPAGDGKLYMFYDNSQTSPVVQGQIILDSFVDDWLRR